MRARDRHAGIAMPAARESGRGWKPLRPGTRKCTCEPQSESGGQSHRRVRSDGSVHVTSGKRGILGMGSGIQAEWDRVFTSLQRRLQGLFSYGHHFEAPHVQALVASNAT